MRDPPERVDLYFHRSAEIIRKLGVPNDTARAHNRCTLPPSPRGLTGNLSVMRDQLSPAYFKRGTGSWRKKIQ